MRSLIQGCVAALLLVGNATADDYTLKALKIDHPFARATPPGATAGGAFLTIENKGAQPDRLVRVASPVAAVVALHQMTMDNGMMKMRATPAIDIKPGDKVELKPGGYHVMLTELKRPLKVGDTFPLRLTFEKAGSIEVSVRVEAIGASIAPAPGR